MKMLLLTIIPYCLIVLNSAVNGDDKGKSLLPDDCGFIDKEVITSSKYARLYEFPWMALISRIADDGGRKYYCSGVVINQWYVITAGHCVKNSQPEQVRVGDYDRQQDIDCESQGATSTCEDQVQDIMIDEAIVHEDFHQNFNTTDDTVHDIALLLLKTPIDFGQKNAAPICLPTTIDLQNKSLQNENAVIAGWELMINGQTSSKMLKTNVSIRKYDECVERIFKSESNSSSTKDFGTLCIGDTEGVCPMESGSPLMVPSATEDGVFRYVQYGIASYGTRDCGTDLWTTFTDVTKHMEWILNKMKS